MIRHLIIAALRNMAANKLMSAISILGLSVGIAAAILMGLVIRNQTTFDDFIPGHERTYMAFQRFGGVLCSSANACAVDPNLPALLKLNMPEIEDITRVLHDDNRPLKLQHGNITGWETLYWADPNVFGVLPLPVIYGDLNNALRRPDGIVLSRSMARKYFGHENVVGEIIMLDSHPMVVRAVIEDFPANGTELKDGIFASGLAPFSQLVPVNGDPLPLYSGVIAYIRLKSGASVIDVEKQASRWNLSLISPRDRQTYMQAGRNMNINLLRLDRVNLSEAYNPGIATRLAVAGLAGLLVLFIAAINFVNLSVARVARREREVGVRKACGADRSTLMLQFLGEAIIAVGLAACIALAASEWLLPAMNTLLDTGAHLDYGGDPVMLPFLLLGLAALGLAAGAYPALVLSNFRPAIVLRGWTNSIGSVGTVRNILVTLQFAILIVLAISAAVIWQQRNYATHEALRVDTDQILLIKTSNNLGGPNGASSNPAMPEICPASFRDEVRKIPGVKSVFCTDGNFLDGYFPNEIVTGAQVDPGIFALYGVKPLAGSLPSASNTGKAALSTGVVLNVAAVRKMGFTSPQAAIGHSWLLSAQLPKEAYDRLSQRWGSHAIITAVVPDFAFTSVKQPVVPRLFSPWQQTAPTSLIHIKLSGHEIPETLAAIDRLWVTTNQRGALNRFFLNDFMQQLYQDMLREAQFFAVFAGLAIILACLGLVGIAVSTAERRTKEMGVRKAMGASNTKILALLLLQFAQPVLWANVIAWPIAWQLMHRWLTGYAYHVDLHAWLFFAASGGTLLVALLTVAGQAMLVARQKPVLALRYE